jgi:hypothetical protein
MPTRINRIIFVNFFDIISYPIFDRTNTYSVAIVDELQTRTTQIVIDPNDANGPKLKEPRGLYSIGNYQHEPRYLF